MKRVVSLIIVLVLALSVVTASTYHSVPLGDKSYRIIKSAELRGIIPVQSDVKPYALNTVRNLLNQIMTSDDINQSERNEIENVLNSLERQYGVVKENSFNNFLKTGKLGFEGDFGNLSFGVKATSDSRVGIDIEKDKIISSRNLATAFIMGDIKDWLSYDINFSFVVDKLDSTAYNFNDFEFVSDGQYFLGSLNDRTYLCGEEGIGIGLSTSPEVSTALLNNSLRINAGSHKRDWGSGINNLGLSGSAKKFEGLDIQYEPTEWFRFSSLVGSLGVTWFTSAYDVTLPARMEGYGYSIGFDNNLSIHRAEFTFGNFKVNLYEAIVWKKRFELSYISPVSIYWIAQNFQGDWDDLLGGFDFSYRFPGFGRLYLSFAIDEFTADIKHLFTNPRNIVAIQGGLEVPVKFANFSLFTIQGTYVPAFFGAHYGSSRPIWGSGTYALTYANGGKGLSYPINPDSLELLISFNCSLARGWDVDVELKDQIQSAQYTQYGSYSKNSEFGNLVNAGMTLNDAMDYGAFYADKYSFRKFFSYIWKNTLDVDVTVSKSFDNIPVQINFGINGIIDWTRDFSVAEGDNYGDKVTPGTWNTPYVRALVKIGFSVYY